MRMSLNLSYKGNRNYLHGSDIFNELSSVADEVTGRENSYIEKISFRGFAKKVCFIETSDPEKSQKVVAEVSYRVPQQVEPVRVFVVEGTEEVSSRASFDEEAIIRNAVFDTELKSAQIYFQSKYSLIENIIALTKFLNYKITPKVSGKWVFGQLDLTRPLAKNCETIAIDMVKLIGDRFSVNDIRIDGSKIGSIRFIVGAP